MLDAETAGKIKQAKDIMVEHLLNHPNPSNGDSIARHLMRNNVLLEGFMRAIIVLLPDEPK